MLGKRWNKFEKICGEDQTYTTLILQFVKEVVNSKYPLNSKLEVHRLIIAMLENVDCTLHIPKIIKLILDQLELLKEPYPKNQLSIYLQTLAMCFFNNAGVALKLVTQEGKLDFIIDLWLGFMDFFDKTYEVRRAILGLSAMI
jgi:hypothetical protein